ncbi:asparagine synthase (glutamine-hydrolyzing) [Devosia sp.]|jgi:asparagine synthase (glutamine-hydrolysing)|uniref:asparagine synthase (glutamine-hydrolyzing) n=1 Tax=Devosia sp. TaxID=1871048 RepID=UPI0037BFC5ED
MCGIVGAFSFNTGRYRVAERQIGAMSDALAHRGPDGDGSWIDEEGRIGFGHRRLAIIDLSAKADQPMENEDGSLRLVFNGEIYNHAEIRRELEALGGHRWRTDHSDTEVIIHAYEQWGIDCLHRFRGMFAIALWDSREQVLWLVRDRMGVKPLYYTIDDNRLLFASEIKSFLVDPQFPRSVDEEALYHYLSFLTTPAPQTLFKGVGKLAAGCLIKVGRDGTVEERRWWDALDHAGPMKAATDEELAEQLMVHLRAAVARRKVSDVPVGVFLSGGIDSSTNLVLFAEGEQRAVKSFSIGYDDSQKSVADELPYARMVAQLVGADAHELRLNQDDVINFLPKLIHLQDEPIADPVCVPVYYLSKLARDNGVPVAQVGEGADELFWGYRSWKTFLQLQNADDLPVPRFVKKLGVAALKATGHGHQFYTEYLRRGAEGVPVFWGGADAFTETTKRALLSPTLRKRFAGYSSWEAIAPIRQRFEEKAWETSTLNWMTYLDLNLRLPELLLMRVDKMSMGVGLEARVPFLDHDVVSFALSLPQSVKTRNGELKYLLKKAVRGLIPDTIIDRRKQGFAVPVDDWFKDRLGQEARATMQTFLKETDFFDPLEVNRVLDHGTAAQSWYLLNFALWWQHNLAPVHA